MQGRSGTTALESSDSSGSGSISAITLESELYTGSWDSKSGPRTQASSASATELSPSST